MRFNILSKIKDTNHYIPALLLIVIFSSLGYINLKEIIESVSNDGKIINISGRQRMLSQKLILLANKYYIDKDMYHEGFTKNIKDMELSHNYLLKNITSKEILKIYHKNGFDMEFRSFISNLKNSVSDMNVDLLKKIESDSKNILIKLELIVQLNEKEYKNKIEHLQEKGIFLFLGIVLVIIVEALFIFYPASRKIKENTKKLEDTIDEKTKELQKSIDIISDYVIYSKTDKKGVITYASNAFSDICGYSKDELVGKPHSIVRHPDMPKSAFFEMWQTIKVGKTWIGEVKNLKKDGGFYWVKANISPEYNEKGDLIGYVGVRYDITHKKEIEELNRNLEKRIAIEIDKNRQKDEQLFEQAKIIQLNEMIGNIAHHWRQPLNIISLSASSLKLKNDMGILDSGEISEATQKVIETTKKLSDTIDEFRDFTKLEQEKTIFYIDEVIDKTIEIVEPSFEELFISITKNYEKEHIEMSSIPSSITQVVLNILYNAKEVFEKNNIKNKNIVFDIKKDEESVIITISDNAGGIKDSLILKIFDPYFTTKHKSQGTGLGLSKSENIVRKYLKGNIYAQNVDNGLCFFIELPLNI